MAGWQPECDQRRRRFVGDVNTCGLTSYIPPPRSPVSGKRNMADDTVDEDDQPGEIDEEDLEGLAEEDILDDDEELADDDEDLADDEAAPDDEDEEGSAAAKKKTAEEEDEDELEVDHD